MLNETLRIASLATVQILTFLPVDVYCRKFMTDSMTPSPHKSHRKMGLWSNIATIFFIVSGGAFGLETIVVGLGGFWTVILILTVPLLWALPIGLLVAELSTALPERGGYYVWVRRGLGKFWGFQEGWWTLCYSAADLALYPVLFVKYLSFFFPFLQLNTTEAWASRWLAGVAFVITCLPFNLRGARAVGRSSLGNLFLVSIPFVALTLIGLPQIGYHALNFNLLHEAHKVPAAGGLAAGLAMALWNFSGWDNVSTYASEVENPARNYPRALILALTLILLSYLGPLLIGLKATMLVSDWDGAGWPKIAEIVGGSWLAQICAFAALCSAWAMFNSQLFYVARLPVAMAQDGFLPKRLAKVSRHEVPKAALFVFALVASVLCAFSLDKLVVVDILLYTIGLGLEFMALIRLRQKEPELLRPFKVPLNIFGLCLMSALPLLLALIVAIYTFKQSEGAVFELLVVGLSFVTGPLIYWFLQSSLKAKSA